LETWSWCLERRLIGGELGIIEVKWVIYYLKNKNKRGHVSCDHAFETFQKSLNNLLFEACFSNMLWREEKRLLQPNSYLYFKMHSFFWYSNFKHTCFSCLCPHVHHQSTLICGHILFDISLLFSFSIIYFLKLDIKSLS